MTDGQPSGPVRSTELSHTNRHELLRLIPNRPPYLWIDEVVEIDAHSIHCRKQIPDDLPLFGGHYPDFPLFPGCLQCEAALQASSVLIAALGAGSSNRIPVATRLNNVQFRQMVQPGDTLDIHVRIDERVGPAFYCSGRIERDGQVTTRLQFAVTEAARPQRQNEAS